MDILLDELHVIYKLLRIADSERIGLWMVEVLDQERQALAAQAAHLLRTDPFVLPSSRGGGEGNQ